MKQVARFEADLLTILRALLGKTPLVQALPLIVRKRAAPKCLSRDCVQLIQQTLAIGCTEMLARSGWPIERSICDERLISGRLWHRYPVADLKMGFSRSTIRLLLWLTAESVLESSAPVPNSPDPLTSGDQFFLAMAFVHLNETLVADALLKQSNFRSNPLVWLLAPERIAEAGLRDCPSFALWLSPDSSAPHDTWQNGFHAPSRSPVWLLEALSKRIIRRWIQLELSKQHITDRLALGRIAVVQRSVIGVFFQETSAVHRHDLSLWIAEVAAAVAPSLALQTELHGRMDLRSLRMADRMDCYRHMLVIFEAMQTLHQWNQEQRSVGFYDEHYQASQLWKLRWEALAGDVVCDRSARLIRQHLPNLLSTS
ncbi:MAG: hypothetical protein KDA81_04425 [Planctomycetaceae bacterium]|nr:hypothetical protein [Planctomycetaceae bacterium]